MARIEKRVSGKQKAFISALPFTKINYQILSAGITLYHTWLCSSCTRPMEWNNAPRCCADLVGARVLCGYTSWYSLS